MKNLLWFVLLTGFSFNAFAQAQGENEVARTPSPWGLGVATAVSDSPYAGEGMRVIPVPLVTYRGERFYFRGASAGWIMVAGDGFELAVVAKPRLAGFDAEDLGRSELARNGIDRDLLEDRDNSLDAGLGMSWRGQAGKLEVELLADVADVSGGQEVSVQYGYPIALRKGMLTPTVGMKWLSEDMADYYYGTLDAEVARGVIDYKPGAVTIPRVGISYFRPLGKKWSLLIAAHYDSLPDEIKSSPLIDPDADGAASMFIGFSRGFKAR